MRKILSIVTTIMFLGIGNSMAETGMGITGNWASLETTGSETLREGGDTTSGSHDTDVAIPELFIEFIGDRGAFGLAYIPVQESGGELLRKIMNFPEKKDRRFSGQLNKIEIV